LGYKVAMKIASVAALAVLVGASACHSSSSGGAGPGASATAAPAAPPAAAAGKAGDLPSLTDFEGQVDLVAKSSTSATPVPLSLFVKNETLRIDAPSELPEAYEARVRAFTGGGKVYAIIKPAEKKTFVVFDAKRQALALDLDTLGQETKGLRAAHGGRDTATEAPPKVVKTGKKEMVAGYSCEDWDIISAKSKAMVCVAEKTSFFHFPNLGIPSEQAWALELVDGKHFPLKAVSFNKDGSEEGRVEVTKIDKHPLAASMFEVPMGYKQVTIEELLMGGMPSEGPHGMPHPHGHHHHH
jgi:hypothetical protein